MERFNSKWSNVNVCFGIIVFKWYECVHVQTHRKGRESYTVARTHTHTHSVIMWVMHIHLLLDNCHYLLGVVATCYRHKNRVFHHVAAKILRKIRWEFRKSSYIIYEKSKIHHVSDCIRHSHGLHRFKFLYLGIKQCIRIAKNCVMLAEFQIF